VFTGNQQILAALGAGAALGFLPLWYARGKAKRRVHAFEEHFAAYCQAAEGIALDSGTAALHLALLAADIGPGDEVLVPSPSYPLFEFLADIQDVRLVPFELVYDEGWQIEFESLRRGISARSPTGRSMSRCSTRAENLPL